MWSEGSWGPGKNPINIMLEVLFRRCRGRFNMEIYIAPTEYCVCLNGWNQSTLIINPNEKGLDRNDLLSKFWKSLQIFPSYISLIRLFASFMLHHCSHNE